MLQAVSGASSRIVASHDNHQDLFQIDKEASRNVEAMVQAAGSIRDAAVNVVVAGVRMAVIKKDDAQAWEEFVAPFQIKTKGRDQAYRQVAHVLFRNFATELQGDGSLRRRTISRDQISRYGAAIALAHDWFEKGCTDLDRLSRRITEAGGVWALAKQWAERHEIAEILLKDNGGALSAPAQLKLFVPRPAKPTLLLILPDGAYRPVPADLADAVVARMLQ